MVSDPEGLTPPSANLGPGAVGVAAGGAAHGPRPAVDVDPVHEVAAVHGAALVRGFRDHLAIAAVVGIAPVHRFAGVPSLPGLVLGLPSKLAIALIERAADLVADDAADHGAGQRAGDAAAAPAELVADHAAGNSADYSARILIADVGSAG